MLSCVVHNVVSPNKHLSAVDKGVCTTNIFSPGSTCLLLIKVCFSLVPLYLVSLLVWPDTVCCGREVKI
jgi:hypothetical protein